MNFRDLSFVVVMSLGILAAPPTLADLVSTFDKGNDDWQFANNIILSWLNAGGSKTVTTVSEAENSSTPASTAVYDPSTKMLNLEMLVSFMNDFNGKEISEKWMFKAAMKKENQFIFKLIPWSLDFIGIFTGKKTSGYITYNLSTRELYIPCLKMLTRTNLGGTWTEGKPDWYKNMKLKLRYSNYPVFQVKSMTSTKSCP